ncbi:hypothetical protein C8J57DRAFT_1502363 [Mycena rebaudengoi]|nr:hypothetical protein C8J57DRAFT_1502363 [Mycena rebaudengoi]
MRSSHIETPNHTWLVEDMPAHLQFLDALNLPVSDQPIENYMVVPRTHHGKLEWAHVGYNPYSQDRTRQMILVYKHPHILPHAPPNMLYPVGIRVQGFLQQCVLGPLGNWSGRVSDPPQKALQFVTLTGGGVVDDIFAKYREAIIEVIEFIYRSLGLPVPHGNWADSEQLFISCRVFTKVTAKNRHRLCVLEEGEDPTLTAKQVEAHWRKEGFKVPCNPMTFGSGDFVDVCIGFDIVSLSDGKRGQTHQVHLKLEHIMLLASAEDLPTPNVEEADEAMYIQGAGLQF